LRNEQVFRSYAESTAELKGRREDEKIIDVADLRQVLVKFGVNYINQDIFVNEFTRNQPAHLEDLLTRMKNCVKQAFDKVQMKLKKMGNRLSMVEMVERMKVFDEDKQGRIKIHHFINVLKHNYSSLFDQETLIGLQFELECLSPADNCVDYEEFVKLFLDRQG
jgi:Ca2+-binding EF-hand superfamily protein